MFALWWFAWWQVDSLTVNLLKRMGFRVDVWRAAMSWETVTDSLLSSVTRHSLHNRYSWHCETRTDNTGNGHIRIRTVFGNFLKTVVYKSGQNGVKSVGWIYTWFGHKWKFYFTPDTVSGQKSVRDRQDRHHHPTCLWLFTQIFTEWICNGSLETHLTRSWRLLPLMAYTDIDDFEAKFIAHDWIGVGRSYNPSTIPFSVIVRQK